MYRFRLIAFFIYIAVLTATAAEKNIIDLTLDNAVNIAMDNSYRIRQLQLGIERSREWLKAEQAGLKSRVYLRITAPEFEAISDYKWNSTLKRDEIIRQNTRLWQANLSIRQPVVLFGYPTNGYLSLNNKIYRYSQIDNGQNNVSYYNRYFIEYEQPFFQPNKLKNDIEKAELSLERRELEYIDDQVDLIDDIADDYYDLFRYAYNDIIYSSHVKVLEQVDEIAQCQSEDPENRSMDCIQIRIELANARERVLQNLSDFRLEASRMKQRLRLNGSDSLAVTPTVKITPINVDLEQALHYGLTLRPRLRLLEISKRQNKIDLTNIKGWNSFHMNLEMTYGLEKQDDSYRYLWNEKDNSYSVALNAYIPIWDWGQRRARINAQEITIRKTELYLEEVTNSIQSEIRTAVQNLDEYQKRALNMQENKEMADDITAMSIQQYGEGKISLQDLLQTIDRQKETELNFLEAYLGYRQSLLNLMVDTYYDYENDIRLLDKFRSQG